MWVNAYNYNTQKTLIPIYVNFPNTKLVIELSWRDIQNTLAYYTFAQGC